ncbi:tripartite tricarboxylate transporter TctB family protein [Pelagibacterium montanilacus]|uniref:tripartite tricarboxylate transporter TctB family protein n=1 Tax=Pelagibacterium montanilacus TaxID=2185280 RepID=UPI000F8F3542|nr:tripartite tricarboxylate transporter TctB family protein [Pelagibacterium montanilacus]
MSDPQTSTDPEAAANRRMPYADLIAGTAFLVLGLVIIYLSWTMPRLEMRGIHPATVPGLVPGLLGIALALCGAMLGGKALVETRKLENGWQDFGSMFAGTEARRFAVAALISLAYALVLLGRVPFWLATGLYVFAFIVAFEVWATNEPKPLPKSMLWAAVQAVIVSAVVTVAFERGFLVRLP